MSRVTVRVPTPLRAYTAGAGEVQVAAPTVGEALAALGRIHAGVLDRVLDAGGAVRGFVNVYVDDRNIRALGGLDTPLADGNVISIVPAVAGGAR
jgi:molybdopterin converting factor small subunit